MKTRTAHTALLTACLGLLSLPNGSSAAEPLPGITQGPAWGVGWPLGQRPSDRELAPLWGRVDLDADMNYDGEVANDSSDDGRLEASPPGLVIGKGEMSKFIIRVNPF